MHSYDRITQSGSKKLSILTHQVSKVKTQRIQAYKKRSKAPFRQIESDGYQFR